MTVPDVTFVIDESGAWSGGGRVFLENAQFAAERHRILGRTGSRVVPIIPRNVPVQRKTTRPYVLVPQNSWPWQPRAASVREMMKLVAFRAASEWYLRRATGLIRIGSAIPAIGSRGATSDIVRNVLDASFDDALKTAVSPPRGAEGALVSVGSANSYRGFETLIRAHEAYRRAGGARTLFIAGPPSNPDYVRRLQSLVGDRRDVVLRWASLSRTECLAAYRSAAIVVMPSRVEASPLTLLEALAVTPLVLCSDIAGHHEVTSGRLDPRSLFEAGNAESLTQRLLADDVANEEPHALLNSLDFRVHEREWWAESIGAFLSDLAARL